MRRVKRAELKSGGAGGADGGASLPAGHTVPFIGPDDRSEYLGGLTLDGWCGRIFEVDEPFDSTTIGASKGTIIHIHNVKPSEVFRENSK